jgi:hypothetical protein
VSRARRALPIGWGAEVDALWALLERAGHFDAFNVTDACPDNHLLAGDVVRFFDFEFAGFAHALLEAAYLVLPFPTCWCVGRLPDALQRRAVDVYRTELSVHGTAAQDSELFRRSLLTACAAWTLRSVVWTIGDALVTDDDWGLATHRQRHIYRLERFAAMADEANELCAIGQVTKDLAGELRRRWRGRDLGFPVYPALS